MIKKLCAYPGCSELVDLGAVYCPRHKESARRYNAKQQAHYDRTVRKEKSEIYAFYRTPEWLRLRAYIMDRYKGLCLWSYAQGILIPAEDVHHIIPIKEEWERRLDPEIMIPLAHGVHKRIEQAYKHGKREKTAMQAKLWQCLATFRETGGDIKNV